MKGILVTFEGIEGSGKSTLITLVSDAFKQIGVEQFVTREPGGTDLGKSLRKVLLDPQGVDITPLAELFLYAADRAQHINEVLLPAIKAGKAVLCDRFSDATEAYQGYGRSIPLKIVKAVIDQAREGLIPDLTVLLDLPPAKSLVRVRKRNIRNSSTDETRFDDEELAFHERVREGYLAISGREPERFLILDGMASPDDLARKVMEELENRFGPLK
ncbi:MAG: dTMP kinase [bacterium]